MNDFSILFVDDQPDILHTYKQLSKKDTAPRKYYFASDGADAIEVLWNQHVDIVITDYNMPILDGLKLTEYIEKNFPGIVRVIVSGCMDYELFADSMKHAHRFIAKPASFSDVLDILDSVTFIHSIINDSKIRKELLNLSSIPTLPEVYLKVCNIMEDEDSFSLRKISNEVAKDIGMSSNILKFINSSYFHLCQSVTRIDQAVSLLGGDIIKMLILRETINSFVSKGESLLVERVLLHSSIVAGLVKRLMEAEGIVGDEADLSFTVAFLHDVGRLILNHSYHEEYSELLEEYVERNLSIEEAEEKYIGISHSKITAYLFSLWGLPKTIVTPILNHHRLNVIDSTNPLLVAVLHVADVWEYKYYGSDHILPDIEPSHEMLHILGMSDKLSSWEKHARSYFNDLRKSEAKKKKS